MWTSFQISPNPAVTERASTISNHKCTNLFPPGLVTLTSHNRSQLYEQWLLLPHDIHLHLFQPPLASFLQRHIKIPKQSRKDQSHLSLCQTVASQQDLPRHMQVFENLLYADTIPRASAERNEGVPVIRFVFLIC